MERALAEVVTEVKAINAILKNKDKSLLYGPSVDDLFTAYGDVWEFVKGYANKYGDLPTIEMVTERFPDGMENVPVDAGADFYVDELRSEYVHNRLGNLLTRAGTEFSSGTSPSEIKAQLQKALRRLDRFSSTASDLDIMDMEEAMRRYGEVRERSIAMNGTPGIPMGLNMLDSSIPLGMQPGDMVTFIGYPARGKSALGALVSAHAIQKGFKPLIFSLEMSAEAVQDRIFTILGKGTFSNTSLMIGDVNEDDFREFSKSASGGGWIVDGNGAGPMTPDFVRSKIDEYRPDFVLLDYYQLFMDNAHTVDMTARMRNLSLELKTLANQTQIPIILICSATPPTGVRVDSAPTVEQIAWSKQASYDSTVCIAIHRFDGSNIYHISGAKNRYGPLPEGYLNWDMDRGVYQEHTELPENVQV